VAVVEASTRADGGSRTPGAGAATAVAAVAQAKVEPVRHQAAACGEWIHWAHAISVKIDRSAVRCVRKVEHGITVRLDETTMKVEREKERKKERKKEREMNEKQKL
jgi:hypothetical protein